MAHAIELQQLHSGVTPGDRLGLTLFLAAALHGIIILGVSFQVEDKARLSPPPALEIILTQNQSSATPEQTDYLAPITQAGGGESDTRERPSSPFTSSEPIDADGIAPRPYQASQPQPKPLQTAPVLTQLYADHTSPKTEQPQDNSEAINPSAEEFEYDLAIAKLTTEINLAVETYAKRPKKLVLTANTQEFVPARYMHEWAKKVERIGNLNLPNEIHQQNIEGSLLLEVEIKSDGSVIETNILRSSGYKSLDKAALKIVQLAGPFPKFPKELKKIADHLEIVRTWQFQKEGLKTK